MLWRLAVANRLREIMMKLYYRTKVGVRFYADIPSRVRYTRPRQSRVYIYALGIPLRVDDYFKPTFYYRIMRNRRKLDLDVGYYKVKYGIENSSYIMSGV